MKKLAIITTHPIQYNAPWFRLLAERKVIEIKVFYTWSQIANNDKFDPGFGKTVQWDIPLMEGYDYTFVKNNSQNPGSKSYSGISNPTLVDEVKGWNPDAVLVFGWKFKSHWKAMKYFKDKIPVLFRGDSTLMNRENGLKNFIRSIFMNWVYKKIDYGLYVGSENKKYFLRAGMKVSQLIYAPHAIDNKRFFASKQSIEKGNDLRERSGIKENELVFLFAGKFESVKNPLIMLEAAKKLNSTDTHFVSAGNGPLEEEMKKFASPHIHFVDFQNQSGMPSLYQMCDVFVLPSESETWGLAVNEAMAAGKPVLVSDQCGCAVDLVVEGITGYTFRSGDVNDLRQKIELLVSQKNELKKMGKNAFVKIQDWSFGHIVEAVEGLVIDKC